MTQTIQEFMEDFGCLETITDLYEWACKKGIEDYELFIGDEFANNCFKQDIIIREDRKIVCL